MTVKVLIASSVAGFPALTRAGVLEILAECPELFGHPHLVEDFDGPRNHDNLEDEFADCVVKDGKVYFLETKTSEFRSSPYVLEKFLSGRLLELFKPITAGHVPKLKIVEIPSGIKWYVTDDDDGSEMVLEEGRVWR
jgi:hypothetical protein